MQCKTRLKELGVEIVDKLDFLQLQKTYFILEQCDQEFIPTLTSVKPIHEHMTEFLRDEEAIFISNDDGDIVSAAFYYFTEDNILHIDGMVTLKEYRNKKYAQRLYAALEIIALESESRELTLTTWSTNFTQLHVLNKIGYTTKLGEERSPGIVTVYLKKVIEQ